MTCNQPNNNTPANISAAAQQAALDLMNAGKAYADAGMKAEALQMYAQAWDALAQAGDRYADNAAGVLGRGADAADNFFKTLVENHWNNTVGADAYASKYDTVASQHLENYLKELQANNGTPPSTQFIIDSYESTLFKNGLDKSAAFDGAWAAAVPGNTVLDSSWAGLLGMEVSRITTSLTTNGLSTLDAAVLIGKDFAQTVASVSLTDPNFLRAIVFHSPVAAALSPTMRDFANRLGEGTWDYLKDALPTALGWIVPDACGAEISPQTPSAFTAAQRFVPRRDPLTLDLNGNGIETVPINAANPVYFDLTGEGVQTSVGWVAPNDGFLVLDRNGNGTIDDGTELFGDATPLYDAAGNVVGKAADGFEALAQEDTNGDGVVNSGDANFASLRVWQDLNQDGISNAGELKTLAELGIASFNVANVAHSQLLANGNQIADTGTYTKADGSTGTAGVTAGMADVNLAVDTFHRTFIDVIPTTVDTATLPDMQGSGVVRDLREASSIQSAEGATLASALGQFSAATTRNEQRAQLDTLIADWGATSGFEDMQTKAAAHGYTLTTNLDAVHQARLNALEQFNGRGFYRMPWETTNAQSGVTGMSVTHDASGDHIRINMNGTQLALLDQAYSALKESVYDALLPQTRLKPYLDDISLTLTDTNINLDFAALDTRLTTAHTGNANTAIGDLLDLRRLMGDTLEGASWDGLALLTDWAATDAADPAVAATLAEFGYGGGIHTAATGAVNGGNANDLVAGQTGDPSTGSGQALSGGAGKDMLLGGNGDDTLIGGTGNDLLHGGAGNDTYVFNAGDGADTILETHGDPSTGSGQAGSFDTLQFGTDITVGDISLAQEGDALVFRNINGRDSVTVAHWFTEGGKNKLDTITFADGRTFDLTTLQLGTINADVLTALATTPGGIPLNQILAGGAGNDTLNGGEGNDWLLGGAGADTMSGGAGSDTYSVDNAGDIVIEAADPLTGSPLTNGVDVVEASVSYTLTDNVENLTLVGAGAISGTGNALTALEGNDTLKSGIANDEMWRKAA